MPNVRCSACWAPVRNRSLAALRIARIATGKKRIIMIGGAYHGWSDQMVYGLKIPGSRALLESHGITPGAYRRTDEVRPNDLDMLEKMLKRNRRKGGTAAVIVEPVGPESGTRPVAKEYNRGGACALRQVRGADDLRRSGDGLQSGAVGSAGILRCSAGISRYSARS